MHISSDCMSQFITGRGRPMTLLQYYHLMRTHDQVAKVWCTAADHCTVYADNTRQGFLQVRKISIG